MAFVGGARDDSHHNGASDEEGAQLDAPDGVSQLMAELCTGESESTPPRDASAASTIAASTTTGKGGLLEAAAAGGGDEGKDGAADPTGVDVGCPEGKAREGEEDFDLPPPPSSLGGAQPKREGAQPKKTLPRLAPYDGPADALMVEIGGAPPGFLREIGGTFTPPDMVWATHLIDAGIDVRFQDKYGLYV